MSRDSKPNLRGSYRLLAMAARLVQRRYDEALAPLGLTRAAVIALEAVSARPLNQEQLAAKVLVQSQTLGRVLARLESQGLVTRTRSEADRRQLHVELTDAGRRALEAARGAEIGAFPTAMDIESWEILQQQLARFVESLERPGARTSSGRGQPGGTASEQTTGGTRHPYFTPGQDAAGRETAEGH